MRIGFLGSGVWATALAQTFRQKHSVSMWVRDSNTYQTLKINLTNPKLPQSCLQGIFLTTDIDILFDTSDLLILCVPSQVVKQFLQTHVFPNIKNTQILLSVTKGMDTETLLTPSQICKDRDFPFVVLSGPSHAEELCIKKNTFVSLGCTKFSIAKNLCTELQTNFLHLSPTKNVYTLEFGGTYKNILAIAIGILQGMGEKENVLGAFLCVGFNEMLLIGKTLRCSAQEISYLSGLGDLITTCFSPNSRNRKLGELLSKGTPLKDALQLIGQVVEGVQSTQSIHGLCQKNNIQANICNHMYNILFNGTNVLEEMNTLLQDSIKLNGH